MYAGYGKLASIHLDVLLLDNNIFRHVFTSFQGMGIPVDLSVSHSSLALNHARLSTRVNG